MQKTENLFMKINYLKLAFIKKKVLCTQIMHSNCFKRYIKLVYNSLECFIPSDPQNKTFKSGIKLLNVVVICLYTYPVSIIFPYHSVSGKC